MSLLVELGVDLPALLLQPLGDIVDLVEGLVLLLHLLLFEFAHCG